MTAFIKSENGILNRPCNVNNVIKGSPLTQKLKHNLIISKGQICCYKCLKA